MLKFQPLLFFTNIGPNLVKQIPQIDWSHREFIRIPTDTEESWFLQPITVYEIVDVVKTFDADKSAGDDQISPMTVNWVIASIAQLPEVVFNSSFSIGVFPYLLKVAKVIPIFNQMTDWQSTPAVLSLFCQLYQKSWCIIN